MPMLLLSSGFAASPTHPGAFWRAWLVACMLMLAGLLQAAHAQQVLPVPALSAHVIDQTGTLTAADMASLESRLAGFEKAKGSQIVVLMVPTTQPEDIASYANRVANSWKIGRRQAGDGLLLIVAKNDRRMRIEVSKALEGAVPDIAAGQIIDDTMKPHFRNNDFAGGIAAAVDQLTRRIEGEALPAPGQERTAPVQQTGNIDWINALVFVVMIALVGGAILKTLLGRGLGSLATGAAAGGVMFMLSGILLAAGVAGLLAMLIALLTGLGGRSSAGTSMRHGGPVILPGPSGGSWGGGWGNSSSGGSWSSGGGGDFGGGGASGDW